MATLTEANTYFAERLNTVAWDEANDATKTKAIAQAQKNIEPYQHRADSTRLFYAVCEQALWLLQGDKRADLQQAGVQGFTVNSMSEQFNTKGRPPTIAPQAWHYLVGVGVKVGTIR